MTITALLDPTQMPNQSQDQTTFDNLWAAVLAALPTWGSQANALAANLNSIAAGGAYSIPYVYSTGSVASTTNLCTVDYPPSAGHLFLNRTIAGGSVDAILQTFGLSTSATKGHIRLVSQTDVTKWIMFSVTGTTTNTNYIDCAVSVVQSSSGTAIPFANNDAVMLFFQRNGDSGTGSQLLLAQATVSTPVANIDFLNVFTSAYDKYLIEFENIHLTASDMPVIQLAVAGAVVASASYTPVLSTGATIGSAAQGGVLLRNSSSASTISSPSNNSGYTVHVRNANSTTAYKGIGVYGMFYTGNAFEAVAGEAAFNNTPTAPCTGFRLFNNSGSTFQSATVRVYGIRNS